MQHDLLGQRRPIGIRQVQVDPELTLRKLSTAEDERLPRNSIEDFSVPDPLIARDTRTSVSRSTKESRMLPETQRKEVDVVLGEFCRREPPEEVRRELQFAVRIHGQIVTLVERRPALRASVGSTESLVARFRFVATTSTLQLFWRDRNSRWHRYTHVRPTKRLATLFAEVRRDPTGVFWG